MSLPDQGSSFRLGTRARTTAPAPHRALRSVMTTTVVVAGMGCAAGVRGPSHHEPARPDLRRSSGFETGPHSDHRDHRPLRGSGISLRGTWPRPPPDRRTDRSTPVSY